MMSHYRLQAPIRLVPLLVLAGCCGREAPVWEEIAPLTIGTTERVSMDLSTFASDDGTGLTYSVVADDGVLADVSGSELAVTAESGFTGSSSLTLTATDACGNEATTELAVTVSDDPGGAAGSCRPHLTYTARGGAQQVFVAGSFNDWSSSATPMVDEGGGVWSVDLDLAPGSYPYKFVETTYGDGASEQWACDPDGAYTQCDEGYTWDPSCPLNGASCNSMLIVRDCAAPTLAVTSLDIDRAANTVSVAVGVTGGEVQTAWATLDDAPIDAWTGDGFTFSSDALSDGRHTLRFGATGTDGTEAEPVYVPVWLDDRQWQTGLLYYVFVDRFADGDPSLDTSEGTSAASTDYVGGDYQGVLDRLDYLDDLGVTVIWLTAPQDNAQGPWDGSCNTTYSGYHGYWPVSPNGIEEHFGDSAKLHELVAAAHARGIRVLTDWVANHVHVDHPYYAEHPDWFNPENLCGDANNWNDIPETCWFDSYLPDIRYYDQEPLVQIVDDAVAFAKEYELDGFRVDAVKHMPHSVYYNFHSRVASEVEYTAVGGDEDFYTVGETFSGDRGLIGSYVNDRELDGQFDFPTYWALVSAFAREESGLSNGEGSLEATFQASQDAFAGHLMSTFLGNHDVARFLSQADGEIGSLYGDSACGSDGNLRGVAQPTSDPVPYQKLNLAWTFLLTSEGLPLVYYGDEIGLPGYNDPDNRQPMRFDSALSANEEMVRAHVAKLGQARRVHPAFSTGTRTEWWGGEAGFYAYARTTGDDEVLVLLNRDPSDRTVTNGLAFAHLTATRWEDVLTGDTFDAAGDSLTVNVPARGSRVLVPR